MKSLSKTFILIVLAIIIAQTFVLVTRTYHDVNSYRNRYVFSGTGKAAGEINFCINNQPALDISDCSPNATQDVYYTCWLFGSDTDNNSLFFYNQFLTINRYFNDSSLEPLFETSAEGYINFTPGNDDVGEYTLLFWVSDQLGCSNSQSSQNFSIQVINVNDPPYFTTPIPNQSVSQGETYLSVYLDNYFRDPDLDDLNYSVVLTNSVFTVTVDSITKRVSIRSDTCETIAYAMFIAEDPYGETASSNLVKIECRQEEEEEPAGSGGGTGGGGGGSGEYEPCKSEYECYDYHRCNITNQKLQKCVDTKGCDDPVFLTVPCKYELPVLCNESWNCSDWEPCLPNGTQTRQCYDMNRCNTTEYMPLMLQECEYIGTCDDGIKNCHDGLCEEGIDCGGPCSAACKSIEVPYPFEEEKSILIYIITGVILLLLSSILLYHYFHKEINSALAKAGWILSRRKKKQLLLSIEDKKRILKGIVDLEKKMDEEQPFAILNAYSELIRFYFMRVKPYQGHLTSEFDLDELKGIIEKKKAKVVKVLRKVFASSFEKYLSVEKNKSLITKQNIILLIEELRNLTLQTSQVEQGDLVKEVKEIVIPAKAGDGEKVIVMLTNTYIALQYEELQIAKKKYLELLTVYEKLSVNEQEGVFEDISRLYSNISYVNSWLEKPKEA